MNSRQRRARAAADHNLKKDGTVESDTRAYGRQSVNVGAIGSIDRGVSNAALVAALAHLMVEVRK